MSLSITLHSGMGNPNIKQTWYLDEVLEEYDYRLVNEDN